MLFILLKFLEGVYSQLVIYFFDFFKYKSNFKMIIRFVVLLAPHKNVVWSKKKVEKLTS